jgi:uracil-DNA glycosylase family 4
MGRSGNKLSAAFDALQEEVVACARCPRLVAWREQVARAKRAAFVHDVYWGKPVPAFGDPEATILVVGLAPAAHGANRTGRMFTGDRSGDWLYRALHKQGLATQPISTGRADGLELHGVLITASVRCAPPANKPTPTELATCRSWLEAEIHLLERVRVVVALGSIAFGQVTKILGDGVARPKARFGHLVEAPLAGGRVLLGSYHPSQQNTFTGKLTESMFDRVWKRAKELAAAR